MKKKLNLKAFTGWQPLRISAVIIWWN